jgi:hypothetical protein
MGEFLNSPFYNKFVLKNSNNPNIKINIGEIISIIFFNFSTLLDTLFSFILKNEDKNITNPIPKLIKIEANITAKYVLSKNAYKNSITVPGQGIIPEVITKNISCFYVSS